MKVILPALNADKQNFCSSLPIYLGEVKCAFSMMRSRLNDSGSYFCRWLVAISAGGW
jgi:hypothetical protein